MNNEDFTKKVHVRCRNGKWSYRFEKAPVGGKRKSAERGGFATEEEAFLAGVQAYTIYENGGAEPFSHIVHAVTPSRSVSARPTRPPRRSPYRAAR